MTEEIKYTADCVAEYVLNYCKEHNISDCSNKKLQKLLYYIQAWNLVFKGNCLFNNEIKAWLHGPVIEEIYHKYKHFGYLPITDELKKFNKSLFCKDDQELINCVMETYGKFDADYLEMRTHIESPWIEARKTLEEIITPDSMEKYYKHVLETYG